MLLGLTPGHALALIVLIIVALLTSQKNLEIHDDIPATFESSAFANNLYHGLQPEYRSYPCFPKRIHLSQESNVIETGDGQRPEVNMTVSFSLDYKRCRNAIATVLYGRGLVSEGRAVADPIHFNYTSAKTGENYESDLIFHVVLPHLLSGSQRYWYRIQVDLDPGMTTTMSSSRRLKGNNEQFDVDHTSAVTPTTTFATPPLPGSPTTIALIGDLGQTDDSTVTMAHMYRATSSLNSDPISLVMFAGDMSYADGEPRRWEHWFDLMEPLLRNVPVHVAAGNVSKSDHSSFFSS